MPLGGESGARLLRYQMLLKTAASTSRSKCNPRDPALSVLSFSSFPRLQQGESGGCCTPRCQNIHLFAHPARLPACQPCPGGPRVVSDVQQTVTHTPGRCTISNFLYHTVSMETWIAHSLREVTVSTLTAGLTLWSSAGGRLRVSPD